MVTQQSISIDSLLAAGNPQLIAIGDISLFFFFGEIQLTKGGQQIILVAQDLRDLQELLNNYLNMSQP